MFWYKEPDRLVYSKSNRYIMEHDPYAKRMERYSVWYVRTMLLENSDAFWFAHREDALKCMDLLESEQP